MRLAILVSAASVVLAIATFACSGSESSKTEAEAPEIVAPGEKAGAPPAPAAPAPDVGDAGDAGVVDTVDAAAASDGDAGAFCKADSIREVEGNNDAASANTIAWKTGSLCGRVSERDQDFVTFTIPSNRGFNFGLEIAALQNVRVRCEVGGASFTLNQGRLPFIQDAPYVCTISAVSAGTTDYRFQLSVTPR